MFSSGNGGRNGDSCAADGYASSIYTIAIGSIDRNGNMPIYEEPCTSKMAIAYSSSRTGVKVVSIMVALLLYIITCKATTVPNNECTSNFTGTSAAAPLATGVILLALEVK